MKQIDVSVVDFPPRPFNDFGGGGGGTFDAGGGGGGPPEEETGACCVDDDEGGLECFDDLTESDCAGEGGTWQGDDTNCIDNPCPGACCVDSDCTIETEAHCVDDLGGEYQGEGTSCSGDPDPCTGCPLINLTCDSIDAARSKCGFRDDSTYPPKYFLTRTTIEADTGSYVINTDGGACVLDVSYSYSLGWVDYFTTDPCAEYDGACSGSGSMTVNGSCPASPGCESASAGIFCGTIENTGGGASPCFINVPGCGPVYFLRCPPEDISFGDEYSTSQLISDTVSDLPAYSGEYTGGACASARSMSPDESTYSIQRSKPKFEFVASASDFYINYNEHFVPSDAGSPSDTPMSIFVSSGSTEAFGDEMFEPGTNGTTTVEDIVCVPA